MRKSKKSYLLILFLILSMLIIYACSGQQVQQQVTQPSQKQEIQETPTKTTEVPKEKIYSMNENANVDYLTYKVTKAETFTEMGTSLVNKKTNGKFVKVYLDITNNAKETKQILTPRFKIIDNQDRQFDRVSDDILYISDGINFGEQLQPSLTLSGAIVFELPKDSEDLKLIIMGDWASTTEIKIALSNIKYIGKDTTLKNKIDTQMEDLRKESQAEVEEMLNQLT